MRVIIAGCGRVGAALATRLAAEGHDVRIVDLRPAARKKLSPGFSGGFHVGNGFSRPVLEAAGIVHADAFVAVMSGDNGNIVSARTAKETYRVPIVLARIHDPGRADLYVEYDDDRVAELGGLRQVRVVAGDACEPGVLEHAGALACDLVVAATGRDEDNLVIGLLAKRQFGVGRVAARVNEEENAWLFDQRWGSGNPAKVAARIGASSAMLWLKR